LVEFTGKRPAAISEQELEAYFLHRRNRDHWSPNTMRISYCGIRFFFLHVLKRDWHLFQILRAKSESRLAAMLSREEVRKILICVRTPHNYAFLSTVYACGRTDSASGSIPDRPRPSSAAKATRCGTPPVRQSAGRGRC
jgi:hypothetical protein